MVKTETKQPHNVVSFRLKGRGEYDAFAQQNGYENAAAMARVLLRREYIRQMKSIPPETSTQTESEAA